MVGFEEGFDKRRNIAEGDAFIDFASDGLGVIDSSAEDDVVAFHFFAGLQFYGGAHEADVANVMLGAGVVATGEVNVDGLVEIDFGFEILPEDDGLSFGVGGSEFAAGVPGAGDESS